MTTHEFKDEVAIIAAITSLEAAVVTLQAAVEASGFTAPTIIPKSQTSGTVCAVPGKLYYFIWSGAAGGPDPYFRLKNGGGQFLYMKGELKHGYILALTTPIPFDTNLTVETDAIAASFGYTED